MPAHRPTLVSPGSPSHTGDGPGGRCRPDRMTGPQRRRVYGSGPDDPDPYEQPGHEYVELVGGALDGQLVDVTSWTPDERATGSMLITDDGMYRAGGRADYEARPAGPAGGTGSATFPEPGSALPPGAGAAGPVNHRPAARGLASLVRMASAVPANSATSREARRTPRPRPTRPGLPRPRQRHTRRRRIRISSAPPPSPRLAGRVPHLTGTRCAPGRNTAVIDSAEADSTDLADARAPRRRTGLPRCHRPRGRPNALRTRSAARGGVTSPSRTCRSRSGTRARTWGWDRSRSSSSSWTMVQVQSTC